VYLGRSRDERSGAVAPQEADLAAEPEEVAP
jgi:hypothetical protein